MNLVFKILVTLRAVANHPLNRKRRAAGVLEFVIAQLSARLRSGDVCVEFPNGTRLKFSPRMKGAAHYISPRLCEFEEMAFVMHFLRDEDLFVDVGANIGVYTVLASGVAHARTIAFEANPTTFETLQKNLELNALQPKAQAVNTALARAEGTLEITDELGTENFIARGGTGRRTRSVRASTLDQALSDQVPTLIKVDVEGFETEVFAGASRTLAANGLKAMIVERSNNGARYGFDETALHDRIRAAGFGPCRYLPFARKLERLDPTELGNIIYVRDVESANARLLAAAPFRLGITEV